MQQENMSEVHRVKLLPMQPNVPHCHIRHMLNRLATLGAVAQNHCIVNNRKTQYDENNEPITVASLYEGVISTDIDPAKTQTKTYKIELHDGLYDGKVKCIIDNGKITAVEITGDGTMKYTNENTYTGPFVNGKRHGEGSMHFSDLKRTYKGNWTEDVMSSNGQLHFDGKSCNYVGDIKTTNLSMHGNGKFHSMDPLWKFKGKFEQDIPVSGSLWENEKLEYQQMKSIQPVSCVTQKPYELDEPTRQKYEEDLATQRASEKRPMETSESSNALRGYFWSKHQDPDSTS